MKLVRIPDSDYADCHALACKGIRYDHQTSNKGAGELGSS